MKQTERRREREAHAHENSREKPARVDLVDRFLDIYQHQIIRMWYTISPLVLLDFNVVSSFYCSLQKFSTLLNSIAAWNRVCFCSPITALHWVMKFDFSRMYLCTCVCVWCGPNKTKHLRCFCLPLYTTSSLSLTTGWIAENFIQCFPFPRLSAGFAFFARFTSFHFSVSSFSVYSFTK